MTSHGQQPFDARPPAGQGGGVPGGAPGGAQAPYAPQQPSGNGGFRSSQPFGAGFFAWVRSLGLRRSTDRWVGGVSGAIANRLGWDPLIIRIIWFAFFCAAGFGALLYGVAWMLLPDERDGSILAEEAIVNAKFPAPFWLAIVFMVVGCPGSLFAIPFLTVPVFVVLIVVAVILYKRDKRSQAPAPAPTPASMPAPAYGPAPESGAARTAGNPSAAPFPNSPVPGAAMPNPQTAGPAPTQPFAAAPAGTPTAAPGAAPGAASGMPQQPPTFTAPGATPGAVPGAPQPTRFVQPPTRPAPPQVVYRRRPAGPVVVGVTSGLILLSLAGLIAWMTFGSSPDMPSMLTMICLWILAVTMLLGIITIIVGFTGRKSGGLIPLTIVAVLATCGAYVAMPADAFTAKAVDSAATRVVGDDATFSTTDFLSLRDHGMQVVDADAVIDLSDWTARHPAGGCPTGELSVRATYADVTVILPDGCMGDGNVSQNFGLVSGGSGDFDPEHNLIVNGSFTFSSLSFVHASNAGTVDRH